MRGVDHHAIAARIDERLGSGETGVSDSRGSRNPEPPLAVLGSERRRHRLFNVLDGDEPDAMVVVVDHQQFLDPPLMEDAPGIGFAGADRDGRQIVPGHQLADQLARVLSEADVAVGEDAAQPAPFLDDGDAADAVRLHQLQRFGERLVRSHGDRVDDHSAFEALHLPHRGGLLFDRQVAVKHADAAKLRQGNRHVRFGHRVHRRRENGNMKRDLAGEEGPSVGLAGQHARFQRLQQDVVERQSERNLSNVVDLGHIGP